MKHSTISIGCPAETGRTAGQGEPEEQVKDLLFKVEAAVNKYEVPSVHLSRHPSHFPNKQFTSGPTVPKLDKDFIDN